MLTCVHLQIILETVKTSACYVEIFVPLSVSLKRRLERPPRVNEATQDQPPATTVKVEADADAANALTHNNLSERQKVVEDVKAKPMQTKFTHREKQKLVKTLRFPWNSLLTRVPRLTATQSSNQRQYLTSPCPRRPWTGRIAMPALSIFTFPASSTPWACVISTESTSSRKRAPTH